jgi:phage gp45-like
VPYAGPDVGFFALPPVGARVWVEFEGGDTNYPIWVGCYWLSGELPAEDATPDVVFFRTPGATIRIEESGTVEIETTGGSIVTLTGSEITMESTTIKQSANGGVTELSAGGFDAMEGTLTVS